jgi:fructose-bisphosphate aldolase class 1
MTPDNLEGTARALVVDGKGILAADETPHTLTKRFDAAALGEYTYEMESGLAA